ncbi:hypothetical protein [Companilactobacillus baiquanensis]|uniref:Uncharacterized protein n=1 Tax=Companilactobacillus baiquanensis TaxID=2486005 RepID=A0ABW1UW46_9LACO|nr:hypothetical protein [Companilactobacillus baiquanensis]
MYFSPIFLQNTLYVVAILLIAFMVGFTIYKSKNNLKIIDKPFILALIVLLNTLYSLLTGFVNLPYELNAVVTGGLTLITFGYIIVIIWDFHKERISEKK